MVTTTLLHIEESSEAASSFLSSSLRTKENSSALEPQHFFFQRNSFFSQLFTVNNLSCSGRGLGQLQEINVIKLTHIYGHSFITSLQHKLWKSFYAMYSILTVVVIQYRFGMCSHSVFGELRFGPYLKISQNSREDIWTPSPFIIN